jgi:hypothetical protein
MLNCPCLPNFLQGRIAELEEKIEAARRNAFTSDFTPSWFVLFKSQQAATMAASTRIYAEDSTQFQVGAAVVVAIVFTTVNACAHGTCRQGSLCALQFDAWQIC